MMQNPTTLTCEQIKWLQYAAGLIILILVLISCLLLYRYLDAPSQTTSKKQPKFDSVLQKVDSQKILYDKIHQAMLESQQQTQHLMERLDKIEKIQDTAPIAEPLEGEFLKERLQTLEDQLAMLTSVKNVPPEKNDDENFSRLVQEQVQPVKKPQAHIVVNHVPLTQTSLTVTKPDKNPGSYVPAGSFAKAVMLGGADVSAGVNAQADPTPMLFRIVEEGTLPNHAKSHLKDCVVTAASRGDISSERGLVRLETLSCTRPTGEIIDVAVEGTIFGPEGKNGVRGIPLWRDGQLLKKAFVAGSLSGFANGLSQQYTTTSISPLGATETVSPGAVFRYGAANGASNAMDKLANYQIQRAEQYHPVIQLSAGIVVDVVFLKGFYLDGKKHSDNQESTHSQQKHTDAHTLSPNLFEVNNEDVNTAEPTHSLTAQPLFTEPSS